MDQFRCPACKRMVPLDAGGGCPTCGAKPATPESLGPDALLRLLEASAPGRGTPKPPDDPMERFIARAFGTEIRRLFLLLFGLALALAVWALCLRPR